MSISRVSCVPPRLFSYTMVSNATIQKIIHNFVCLFVWWCLKHVLEKFNLRETNCRYNFGLVEDFVSLLGALEQNQH